ncbi:MAG: preprotein translocase subunit SecE [Syntrophaceae bacterium]|nr:preprotein translocase subunit SecE [Syntrophaceae bacterium]
MGVRIPPGLPPLGEYAISGKRSMERIKAFIRTAQQFFREVRVELKKVTWPTRKETIASTSVVLITVFLVAFYLGVVDLGLSRLIKIFLE